MTPPPFAPTTQAWFDSTFESPTDAQVGAWDAIAAGNHALVVAPTGSGKTLAAFLASLDRLTTTPTPPKKARLRVLYISPLKALAFDVERNLRGPLIGIQNAAAAAGQTLSDVTVGVRTGDTPEDVRRRMRTTPPDILITTPESIFLLLTSQARETLGHIDTVIIDEIHAVAGTKRGAHLALSLERLDELLEKPAQRIGLSATVRPVEDVANFLGGGRPVTIVEPPSRKEIEINIIVPVEDMTELPRTEDSPEPGSIWPAVEERLVSLIRAHRSTIVFANSRRLSERLCNKINDLAGEQIARAHHGSVAREQRVLIEEELKAGRLPCVVATSSLELGIDMGAVDLVVQIEAPPSVASGLQRIGRAGHHVGEVSRGVMFPKFRGDLLGCTAIAERMMDRSIESLSIPHNPLDVLAQHIVSMVAMDEWTVDGVERLVQRSAPFSALPRSALESVLDMLSGRYPSDEFAELRPRLNWDRIDGRLTGRPGAQRLAVTSGGTIPDRGLFGVFLAGDGSRVGELDEEMVYESRPGEVFTLGATSWRIEDITRDRVIVTPAPGQPGRMPFWRGDALGRPLELGRALGVFVREVGAASETDALARLAAAGCDNNAARNLLTYITDQRAATGALPDDRTIVVERFRDELGDWRVCIHSPFGARVHAPWAQAIEGRLRDRLDMDVQCVHSDDGIMVRLPEADEVPAVESILFDPAEIEDIIVNEVGGSAVFASRFRECAARALLIPRRRPGQRTPLWQQRQRSADLLAVASKYGSFPIILESYRECLRDVFDVPGLIEVMTGLATRNILVVEVETSTPSPFASSLAFGYVGSFLYEGDAPMAERRAQALTLDRRILAELLGQEELRDLIDPTALEQIELELQKLPDDRKARDIDGIHDLLRVVGDLSEDEVRARTVDATSVAAHLRTLIGSRRAITVRIAGEKRWIAIEDAGRVRDGLGTALPTGVPAAFLEAVADPVGDLIGRYARTHGPFIARDVAARLGVGVAVVEQTLLRLRDQGRVTLGAFRPGGSEREWIDSEVLRIIRRRSLAVSRAEIEAVPVEALARFSPSWHGLLRRGQGPDAIMRAIESIQGTPVPASTLVGQILGARVEAEDLSVALDETLSSGEVVWCGAGALGSTDGWVVLARTEDAGLLLPLPDATPLSDAAEQVRATLDARGALFFRQLAAESGVSEDGELLRALWEAVWAGHVTNDTFAPIRALVGTRARATRASKRPRLPARGGPAAGSGRWSLTPARHPDHTTRLYATAEQMIRRHGIVTRGVVAGERIPGAFAAVYPVLKALEERGRCRRGYFVDGLGGAQFAATGAVDRLRALARDPGSGRAVLMAATDPANPWGASIAWPDTGSHRAGRKAGALVVAIDGELVLYIEKGGRTVLTFTKEEELLGEAARCVVVGVRERRIPAMTIDKVDGEALSDATQGPFLSAGFVPASRGIRVRA